MDRAGLTRDLTAVKGKGSCREGSLVAAAPGIVVAEAAGAVPDAVEAIEMAAHEDAQPRAGAPARLLVNLQPDALEGDGVVLTHGAELFVTEDVGEVHAPERDKGRGRIRGRAKRRSYAARKCSRRYRLAAETVLIPATRSSLTRRPWKVRLRRSLRPRACGE